MIQCWPTELGFASESLKETQLQSNGAELKMADWRPFIIRITVVNHWIMRPRLGSKIGFQSDTGLQSTNWIRCNPMIQIYELQIVVNWSCPDWLFLVETRFSADHSVWIIQSLVPGSPFLFFCRQIILHRYRSYKDDWVEILGNDLWVRRANGQEFDWFVILWWDVISIR